MYLPTNVRCRNTQPCVYPHPANFWVYLSGRPMDQKALGYIPLKQQDVSTSQIRNLAIYCLALNFLLRETQWVADS